MQTTRHDLYRVSITDALIAQAIRFDSLADTRALHTLLVALGTCAECAPAPVVTRLSSVPTPDLRVGDVVLTHGMRVLLDREPHVYSGTYSKGAAMIPLGVVARPVYSFRGRVLNVEETRGARVVPVSWLHDDAPQSPTYGRSDVWTVQGNEWATWTVERAAL